MTAAVRRLFRILPWSRKKKQKTKNKEGYDLVIDTRYLSISELLNLVSKKITIDDVEIDHEDIDNIIVKLYEDYKI